MGMTDEELIEHLRDTTVFAHSKKEVADRIEQLVATNKQLNKNCEALSQLVDSVSESRDFWMNEYVKRCLYE